MFRNTDTTSHWQGFTIIEVMIVLAIAGLIMLVVFIAVPIINQRARDNGRRHFIGYAAAQLDAYRTDHQMRYPSNQNERCDFMLHYLPGFVEPSASCSHDGSKNCELVQGKIYTICYHSIAGDHAYIGETDEISIEPGHWCNTDPARDGEPSTDPITNGKESGDENPARYVVWGGLERTRLYCVDNNFQ